MSRQAVPTLADKALAVGIFVVLVAALALADWLERSQACPPTATTVDHH